MTRTACVVGAMGQIGRPAVRALADDGWQVVALSLGGKRAPEWPNGGRREHQPPGGRRCGRAGGLRGLRPGRRRPAHRPRRKGGDTDRHLQHGGLRRRPGTQLRRTGRTGRLPRPPRAHHGTLARRDSRPAELRDPQNSSEVGLLASGDRLPVTLLRPAAIQGPYSRMQRELYVVKRAVDHRPVRALVHGGTSRFHTSSTEVIAELVRLAAAHPGTRVLNATDPRAPTVPEIAASIDAITGHDCRDRPDRRRCPSTGHRRDTVVSAVTGRLRHDRRRTRTRIPPSRRLRQLPPTYRGLAHFPTRHLRPAHRLPRPRQGIQRHLRLRGGRRLAQVPGLTDRVSISGAGGAREPGRSGSREPWRGAGGRRAVGAACGVRRAGCGPWPGERRTLVTAPRLPPRMIDCGHPGDYDHDTATHRFTRSRPCRMRGGAGRTPRTSVGTPGPLRRGADRLSRRRSGTVCSRPGHTFPSPLPFPRLAPTHHHPVSVTDLLLHPAPLGPAQPARCPQPLRHRGRHTPVRRHPRRHDRLPTHQPRRQATAHRRSPLTASRARAT